MKNKIQKEEFLTEGAFIGNITEFIDNEKFNQVKDYIKAVSYTHLTLPTIYSV